MSQTNLPSLKTFEITLTPKGVAVIAFNQPERGNSLSPLAFLEWLEAIRWAAREDAVKVTVFTGKGRFYSAGQELAQMSEMPEDEARRTFRERLKFVEDIVYELISFPKLLIAAVNGSAVGVGVTTLSFCDIIYAVPEATFQTPFVRLGLCAEACSSYLFPKIFGPSIANEFLLIGRTFTAPELEKFGFISRLIPRDGFLAEVVKLATRAAQNPLMSVTVTKNLMRAHERETLMEIVRKENDALVERMISPEARRAIEDFIKAQRQKRNEATTGSSSKL